MTLEVVQVPTTGNLVYTLTMSQSDAWMVPLDAWDRLMIEESERSNSIADKLLALETIARRLEGMRKPNA